MTRSKEDLLKQLEAQFANAPDKAFADERLKERVVLGFHQFSDRETELAEKFYDTFRLGGNPETLFAEVLESVQISWDMKQEDKKRARWREKIISHIEHYTLEEIGFDPNQIKDYVNPKLQDLFVQLLEENADESTLKNMQAAEEDSSAMWEESFQKSHTIFNLEGEIVSHKVYEYELRPELLPKLREAEDLEEYARILDLAFGKKETVIKSRPEKRTVIELQSGLLFGHEKPDENSLMTFLKRYFAYRFFMEELVADQPKEAEALGDLSSYKLKWKGKQNLLDSLIYSLHDAGYLEGDKANTFRAFDAIFQDSNMEKQASSRVNNFVKVKDGAAHTRFNAFLDELKAFFEEYMRVVRKRG